MNGLLQTEWSLSNKVAFPPLDERFKAQWKCSSGHEWTTAFFHRIHGANCPTCSEETLHQPVLTSKEELMDEWDWEKNQQAGFDPNDTALKSEKRVFWICRENPIHRWQIKVWHRAVNGSGCNLCFQILRKPPSIVACDDIMEVWDWEANCNIAPETLHPSSKDKVGWKCSAGHTWKQAVHNYARLKRCPTCHSSKRAQKPRVNECLDLIPYWSSRNKISASEITTGSNIKVKWFCSGCNKTWEATVRRFREQQGCKACAIKSETVVPMQVDGESALVFGDKRIHVSNDRLTQLQLQYEGALTFSDLTLKMQWVCPQKHIWKTSLYHRIRGAECPDCSLSIVGKAVVASFEPLLDEWDWDKNDEEGLLPNKVALSDTTQVNWKCLKGHEWIAIVANRIRREGEVLAVRAGCLVCNKGQKPVVATRLDLMTEWNLKANKEVGFDPDELTLGCHTKAHWKCLNEHTWIADISSRAYGAGCPSCASQAATRLLKAATKSPKVARKRTVQPSLSTRHDLMKEWDPKKTKI